MYFLHLFLDYRKWKRYRKSSKAGRSITDERRLKGGWQDVPSQPKPLSAGRFDSRWKEEGRNRFPLVGRKNAVIFMDSVIARQAISGISRLLLIFLPLVRWIQRNSRQQEQIEPQSSLNSTYRRCTIRTMHLLDEPYPSTCAYMRARNIIMCVRFSSCSVVFKKYLWCPVVNQRVTNKFQKSVRKIRWYVWQLGWNRLPLHPQSREMRHWNSVWLTWWDKRRRVSPL